MIVDPRKLDECRELIDAEVAEHCLINECSWRDGLHSVARGLNYRLEYFKVDAWYSATLQSQDDWSEVELYRDAVDYDRAGDADVESRMKLFSVASDPCNAAIASLIRALDADADIYMSESEINKYYPGETGPNPYTMFFAIGEAIKQERWFGVVSQFGRASQRWQIASSGNGVYWLDADRDYEIF
ncbi:MAG: hypothetical protein AAF086_04850 [Planctomycetota bacterium]